MFPRTRWPVVFACAVSTLWGSASYAVAPTLSGIFPGGGQRGTTFEVTLMGKFDGSPRGIWVEGDGVVIEPPDAKGLAKVRIDATAKPGLRLVRAWNAEGVSAVRWFAVGSGAEVTEVEPNDGLSPAQSFESLPVCINGRLEKAGDVDNFSFALKEGETLSATVDAYSLGSPLDAMLHLLDEKGTRLATASDARNLDPMLAFKAPKTGNYLLQLVGFVHPPAADVRFTGGANVVYRLTVSRSPIPVQLRPAVIALGQKSSPHGIGIDGKDTGEVPVSVDLLANEEGVQTISGAPLIQPVQAFATKQKITLEKEPNEAAGKGMAITLPGVIAGQISSATDKDVFVFSGKKGQRIQAQVIAALLGHPMDAQVQFLAMDGKVLTSNDDAPDLASDASATLTLPADGSYQVMVSDLFQKGGPRADYVLSVGEEQPSFTGTFTTEPKLIVKAGAKTEVAVKVSLKGGWKGPLVLRAHDLPVGVICDPMDIPEKGGEVKLALATTANAAPWSGPFRITIGPKDATNAATPSLIQYALRDSDNRRGTSLKDTSAWAWLTVTPAAAGK
ncbi:MAG: PPC domain-containing protein [Verrucomicrobiales bacterium]|nr:PPC domain-containing protein [Verrucomicrobiales bacterium]MCP5556559.1 PPC domain-containing protein [Verrucomicrobiaceae bacterium]